jgi:hypothetical protein
MKRFTIYRPKPPEEHKNNGRANNPEEIQCEGVLFDDGTVSVRWLTKYRSFSNWENWESFEQVHGHPEYGTIVKWLDDK